MKNIRELAAENVFEVFLNAAIVYLFYTGGKNWFLKSLKGRTDSNSIAAAEYRTYKIWFLIAAAVSTLWYFMQGQTQRAELRSLTAFLVIFFSSLFGTYMAAFNEKEKNKKQRSY